MSAELSSGPSADAGAVQPSEATTTEAANATASDATPDTGAQQGGAAVEETMGGDTKDEQKMPASAAPGIPTLTLTPAFVSRELVTLRQDSGMVASYEKVADNVLTRPWRRTSLFFTSTQANEGSTAVAVNMATMLSRTAESTLLVELQVTEPSLWSLFGRPAAAAGFEEALRGNVAFDDCLYQISGEKLDVLLVKEPMSIADTANLSGMLNDFLEWAEERFAWLVVDCPPVLAETWTRWFDLNADPVVLVAGRSRAKKHELRKVAQHLGDRLVGTILNDNVPAQRAS